MCEMTAIPSAPSCDLHLKAIEEMYCQINTGWLISNTAFHEDRARTRTVASLKASTTVKSMLTEENLVYDERTSFSEYDDSDESAACQLQKKPKKMNLDDEDKKVFTCLPTCYAMFFHSIPRML